MIENKWINDWVNKPMIQIIKTMIEINVFMIKINE